MQNKVLQLAGQTNFLMYLVVSAANLQLVDDPVICATVISLTRAQVLSHFLCADDRKYARSVSISTDSFRTIFSRRSLVDPSRRSKLSCSSSSVFCRLFSSSLLKSCKLLYFATSVTISIWWSSNKKCATPHPPFTHMDGWTYRLMVITLSMW